MLHAVQAELAETGYAETSVEKIAARAGVAKTTVYRRWGNVPNLVLDLLNELSLQAIPIPDTGTLDADLRALAHSILNTYRDPTLRTVADVLVSAAVHTLAVRDTLTAFWTARNLEASRVVQRAIHRGEISNTTDSVEVIRTLEAPFFYRMFITGEPVDEAVAERAAAIAAYVARTG